MKQGKLSRMFVVAAATLFAMAGQALAHGDQSHAKKPTTMKKEQKDWGIAGDANAVTRTVIVKMMDNMRFSPELVEVKQGETVKFVLSNDGKVVHEFVIGTKKENDAHAQQMIKFPNMEHDEPYMAHVDPGKKGEVIWAFNRAGDFDFACLIAGHYQAGMVGKIKVVAVPAARSAFGQDIAKDMAEAEVRKVDKDAKKVTLKHGPIKNLDMPSMTMVFQVRDDKLFDKLVAGKKILFSAEQQQGAFVVTGVERSTP